MNFEQFQLVFVCCVILALVVGGTVQHMYKKFHKDSTDNECLLVGILSILPIGFFPIWYFPFPLKIKLFATFMGMFAGLARFLFMISITDLINKTRKSFKNIVGKL